MCLVNTRPDCRRSDVEDLVNDGREDHEMLLYELVVNVNPNLVVGFGVVAKFDRDETRYN